MQEPCQLTFTRFNIDLNTLLTETILRAHHKKPLVLLSNVTAKDKVSNKFICKKTK